MADEDLEKFESDLKTRQQRIIDAHIAQLCEHFDSVQIVATHYCPQTGTGMHSRGGGNWYSRVAAGDEWLRSCKRK